MENTQTTHHNSYIYQFEIIVTVLAIVLLAFGLYNSAFSQTGGNATYNHGGVYDVYPAGSTGGIPAGNVMGPQGTSGVYSPQTLPDGYVLPTPSFIGPQVQGTYYNAAVAQPAVQTGGTGGGQTAGYNTGGYYGTGGGMYNYQGIYDNDPSRTQGGYVPTKGSGIYNSQGILEAGAVPTTGTTLSGSGQGVFTPKSINDQNLTSPTQNNVSAKNCEFITKYHKFGDRGGDVPKIQQFLKDRGYYNGRIDGVYGIGTFRAVRNFQKDYKDKILDPWEFDNRSSVEGTGVTNVSTKYAINKMVGCPDPATIVPKTGRVLNY